MNELFEERKFQEIVDILSAEEEERQLSFDEYFYLTKSYGRVGKYSNGLIYANKMVELSNEAKDTAKLVRSVNLVAENLIDLNDIKRGIAYCEKVEPLFRKQDSLEFQKLCFKWGMLYYHDEQFEKAYKTYNKITHKDFRKLSLFTNNYALTLMGMKKWNESLEYLKKSIQIDHHNGKNISINLSNMGSVYMNLKQWKQAEIHLDSAVKSLTQNSSLSAKKSLYENYFDLFRQQNKLGEAREVLEHIAKIDKQIFGQKVNEKIHALETASNRESNLTQKVKIIDNQLEVSQRQMLWGTIISLLLIIGLLTALFFFKYRHIKAAHENIIIEQKLLRSQMTPHFIFNSLSVLQGMILNKEDKKAVSYLSKFSKLLRLILENSREKLVPLQDELNAVKHYVDLQNMRNKHQFKYRLTFNDEISSEQILIPPMLIQPFVENAIEHGFKKDFENAEIDVNIHFKNNKLTCIITDNGVGINEDKIKTNDNKKSLATKITTERLKIISKEFKVESDVTVQNRKVFNEKGTLVTLILPYKINKYD
ncbi:histidine kinase [Aureibaculum sp. 2210JD6-5]|uniref:tetratricopeptide repeat-containing sensor histidine kinase n=1 Tax=Aureibaculum sp. 2210JD6-5 TaxID=3103957 RepID=UPI002AAD854B|nr:histidine kinase [Aureibaculum sp. 2210JD6-5]MDY7395860.1 histidine kinase [Aureibaculum sp. 2210JD6-5]